MSNKKFNKDNIKDTHGPMNSVSKEDALVWANAPDVKHLSKLEPHKRREVIAKRIKQYRAVKKRTEN